MADVNQGIISILDLLTGRGRAEQKSRSRAGLIKEGKVDPSSIFGADEAGTQARQELAVGEQSPLGAALSKLGGVIPGLSEAPVLGNVFGQPQPIGPVPVGETGLKDELTRARTDLARAQAKKLQDKAAIEVSPEARRAAIQLVRARPEKTLQERLRASFEEETDPNLQQALISLGADKGMKQILQDEAGASSELFSKIGPEATLAAKALGLDAAATPEDFAKIEEKIQARRVEMEQLKADLKAGRIPLDVARLESQRLSTEARELRREADRIDPDFTTEVLRPEVSQQRAKQAEEFRKQAAELQREAIAIIQTARQAATGKEATREERVKKTVGKFTIESID